MTYNQCGFCAMQIFNAETVMEGAPPNRTEMSNHLLFCDGLMIAVRALAVEIAREIESRQKKKDPYYG